MLAGLEIFATLWAMEIRAWVMARCTRTTRTNVMFLTDASWNNRRINILRKV